MGKIMGKGKENSGTMEKSYTLLSVILFPYTIYAEQFPGNCNIFFFSMPSAIKMEWNENVRNSDGDMRRQRIKTKPRRTTTEKSSPESRMNHI